MTPRTYVAVPFYQSIVGACGDAVLRSCSQLTDVVGPAYGGDAFLARNFNSAWCQALNTRQRYGWKRFCMIHADVKPHVDDWLDTLNMELERTGADLLSVVLPVKTYHGITSTAVEDPTGRIRQLTMREVDAIPNATFDAEQAGFPGCKLLCSTGLWICRFDKPWVEEVDERGHGKFFFEVRDRIVRQADGTFERETMPEDWHFSRLLHGANLKVLATRIIPCGHWGSFEYKNSSAWGTEAQDVWRGPYTWMK